MFVLNPRNKTGVVCDSCGFIIAHEINSDQVATYQGVHCCEECSKKELKSYEVQYCSVVQETYAVIARSEDEAIDLGRDAFLIDMGWSEGDQDISLSEIEEVNS